MRAATDEPPSAPPAIAATRDERATVLVRLDGWLEAPVVALGLIWLVVLVLELVLGAHPVLDAVSTSIWVIFVADFALRFWLAPHRWSYLRQNWLALLSLALPALRVFRIARLSRLLRLQRATRGLRAARLATALTRAMRSVRAALGRAHGAGYVAVLTAVVTAGGAAGMLAFERAEATSSFDGYGHALWWTAMLVASMGTETWPGTFEGRLLSLGLTLYGFAMFGYLTASLASWLTGRAAPSPPVDR